MHPRLLDLIVCPHCHSPFDMQVFREEAPRQGASSEEILEGALTCAGCGRRFPIIKGVPRLLRPALAARMRPRYPEFFAAHPEFLLADDTHDPLADTLESFTRQRLDLGPPGPEVAAEWRANLVRNLG